jgi:hypothetical protein
VREEEDVIDGTVGRGRSCWGILLRKGKRKFGTVRRQEVAWNGEYLRTVRREEVA